MKTITVIVLVCLAAVDGCKIECNHGPMEIGIILDTSASVRSTQFETMKGFVHDFLDHFFIGDGHDDVRVSLVTFGFGIDDGFGLDTYKTKQEVLAAVLKAKHTYASLTMTAEAIAFMHYYQMTPYITRPWAKKLAIVMTDGDSQRPYFMADEAFYARDDNITMYAVGIGNVKMSELRSIAGSQHRVIKVEEFDQLNSLTTRFAKKVCRGKGETRQ